MPDDESQFGFETLAIHAGQPPDQATGAVVTPIAQTSTFAQSSVGEHQGYDYGRTANPTRTALETCLAALEVAAHGRAFSSGMSAVDAVLRLLDPGDHLLMGNDVYGGTYRLLSQVHRRAGLRFDPVSLEDPAEVEAAWQSSTRMVWVESPSNPTLKIADITALAELAHARDALLVVDNTFATPYLQQPLLLGADIVVHSTTKYLGGHSDVIGGFVATSDDALSQRIAFLQNTVGAVPSPFDCFLVLRGIKTLAVRMERHCANAARVAEVLSEHPNVGRVYYPGLPEHRGHDLARAQMRGFGGMVSFTVRGGEARALTVASSTSIFTLAESLGAVESLIEHPHRMTHASLSDSMLAVDPSLLRLSVGLEDIDDLIGDLRSALLHCLLRLTRTELPPRRSRLVIDGDIAVPHRMGRGNAVMKVITLGTGSPLPDPNRAGPSTLVRTSSGDFLFDCGRGVLMRSAAAGTGPLGFHAVLLTHLHSDHTTDFNDIVTMRWAMSPTEQPLRVIGPVGTRRFADLTLAMLEGDIGYRMAHHRDLTWRPTCEVQEVSDGVAFDDGAVRIIAAPTDHAPVHPTVGYRVESEGRSVCIAGDTVPCDGLDQLAAGADVYVQTVLRTSLVREIPSLRLQDILDYHSSIEDAAATATRAGVATLVLTHLVPSPWPGTEEEWADEARAIFAGGVVVASDLSEIVL